MTDSLGRDALVADATLVGADWCQAYSDRVDAWLVSLFEEAGAPKTVALCAIGGYGRAELCPQSDIDVVLLHKGHDEIATIAERLWYPVWDEGLKLGHGVRTVKEAVNLAASDLDTATSLLDVRLLAGDDELADALRKQALELWQKRHRRWL